MAYHDKENCSGPSGGAKIDNGKPGKGSTGSSMGSGPAGGVNIDKK